MYNIAYWDVEALVLRSIFGPLRLRYTYKEDLIPGL